MTAGKKRTWQPGDRIRLKMTAIHSDIYKWMLGAPATLINFNMYDDQFTCLKFDRPTRKLTPKDWCSTQPRSAPGNNDYITYICENGWYTQEQFIELARPEPETSHDR